jgi:hypothetical protein
LIIARLDRLSRNMAFIANLMDARVDFIACDNPHATRLTLRMVLSKQMHHRLPNPSYSVRPEGV